MSPWRTTDTTAVRHVPDPEQRGAPGRGRAGAVVGAVGLDLVTFQGQPYQPRFLDTWTLLCYVAASTVQIGLAPNVLNLPLRPPAMVARAAASLDLLSGGRIDLGLGAGAFGDAAAAMGGPRRTPGEANPIIDEVAASQQLVTEHVVIHQVLDSLDRALVDFVTDPTSGIQLRRATDQLSDTLLSHLSYEERELVEPLARLGVLG